MDKEVKPTAAAETEAAPPQQGTALTPDAAENTVAAHMIPKARFDEVNNRAKAAEAELAKLKAAAEAAEQEKLKAQGEWQKLAEQAQAEAAALKAQAEEAATLRTALQAMVDARKKDLPEHLIPLLEKLTPAEALAWLEENADKLRPPTAPPTDAGARGERGKTPPNPQNVLSKRRSF